MESRCLKQTAGGETGSISEPRRNPEAREVSSRQRPSPESRGLSGRLPLDSGQPGSLSRGRGKSSGPAARSPLLLEDLRWPRPLAL